jgi:hypothetical protein
VILVVLYMQDTWATNKLLLFAWFPALLDCQDSKTKKKLFFEARGMHAARATEITASVRSSGNQWRVDRRCCRVPNKKYRIIQLDLLLLYYVQVELPASTAPILPLDAWNHTSIQQSLELDEYNNGNNGLTKAYKPEELMCRYYLLCRYFFGWYIGWSPL